MNNGFNDFVELYNLANFVTSELRASSPYRTGNMQRSISITEVITEDGKINIVIATNYSHYVNDLQTLGKGKPNPHYHWVQKVLDRACRAYANNDVDARALNAQISYKVLTGSEGD